MPRMVSSLALIGVASAVSHQLRREAVPGQVCSSEGLFAEDICSHKTREATQHDLNADKRSSGRAMIDMAQLDKDIWEDLSFDHKLRFNFFEAWRQIRNLDAADIFATKETWSKYDQAFLWQFGSQSWLDQDGHDVPLSVAAIKKRLPSLYDLKATLNSSSVALVGNGAGLDETMLGEEIESKTTVVRFDAVNEKDLAAGSHRTGTKTTMQVVDGSQLGSTSSMLFDMDQDNYLHSYCQRFFREGNFVRPMNAPLFMMLPTAFCKFNKDARALSRNFMFYWFVSSMSKDMSLYGYTKTDSPLAKAEEIAVRRIVEQMSSPVVLLAQGVSAPRMQLRS